MPKQLLPGESLALPPLHQHWVALARSLAPPALFAVVVLLLVDVAGRAVVPADLRLLATLAAVAGLGLWAIAAYMLWSAASLIITDQRVILEQGILRRSSKVIPLDRVQDVSTAQTLLGRLLDYGVVEIDAAGAGGVQRFPYVGSPERLRDHVFLRSGQLRRGA